MGFFGILLCSTVLCSFEHPFGLVCAKIEIRSPCLEAKPVETREMASHNQSQSCHSFTCPYANTVKNTARSRFRLGLGHIQCLTPNIGIISETPTQVIGRHSKRNPVLSQFQKPLVLPHGASLASRVASSPGRKCVGAQPALTIQYSDAASGTITCPVNPVIEKGEKPYNQYCCKVKK